MATNLLEVVGRISLKGESLPRELVGFVDAKQNYACDCGACDDGGYCICNDNETARRDLKYN